MPLDLSSVSLPFDRLGNAVSNKIENERHTLTSVNWTEFNIIIPKYAPFFSESIDHLIHLPSGNILERGKHWCEGWYFQSASGEIGLDIHCCIYFYDPHLSGEVEIPSYQAMGGEWQLNGQLLTQVLAQALLNPLRYYWEQIANLPEIFNPLDHDQDIQDFTKLGDLIDAIQSIAIALGGSDNGLETHVLNRENPHGTNKFHVNLGNVNNWPVASVSDIIAGQLVSERYMNPPRTYEMISSVALPVIQMHANRINNPHNVQADQTGAYFQAEVDAILESLAAGLVHNLYAYRLEGKSVQEIVDLAASNQGTALDQIRASILATNQTLLAHEQRIDNPHNVQADQTGTYFGTEIDTLLSQLAAGNLHNVYAHRLEGRSVAEIVAMAATGGQQALDDIYNEILRVEGKGDLHAGNLDNPHNTRADDTGAYFTTEVDALLAQLAAGSLYNVYAYRLEGKSLDEIVAMAATGGEDALNAINGELARIEGKVDLHSNNIENPHNVQADQTGAYFQDEVDALLVQLAAGNLDAVHAAYLEGLTLAQVITQATAAAMTAAAIEFAAKSSITPITNALTTVSNTVLDHGNRLNALEQETVPGGAETVLIAAGATHTIDLQLYPAPGEESFYDYLGTTVTVLVQDTDPLSPTVDSFFSSEAVITRIIRENRYLDLVNHSDQEQATYVRVTLNKL